MGRIAVTLLAPVIIDTFYAIAIFAFGPIFESFLSVPNDIVHEMRKLGPIAEPRMPPVSSLALAPVVSVVELPETAIFLGCVSAFRS